MKLRWTLPAVVAGSWLFVLAVYSRLPARIPLHWNLHGEVDRYGARATALVFPLISTALPLLLLWVLPRLDPRRAHWARFGDEAQLIVAMIVLFLAWCEVISLGVALGWKIDVARSILVGIGVMFAAIGNYLPRIRSNWWMGVRTPWTLSSERVWRETHRVGGRSFVAGGLACALTAALLRPPLMPVLPFILLAVGAGVPVVYSYLSWRREPATQPENGR